MNYRYEKKRITCIYLGLDQKHILDYMQHCHWPNDRHRYHTYKLQQKIT